MKASSQYINIYNENKELINANSADCLNNHRQSALEKLNILNLPELGSENYPFTDLSESIAPDYGINIARLQIPVNPAASFKCDVPNMSTAMFFLINDAWACTDNSFNKIPEGVIIGSLAKVAKSNPELVGKYYNTIADIDNPIVQLNTLLCQDGLFMFVPKGVKVDKPIQLVNILQSEVSLMVCRRILIVLEEDAEAQLLMCDHTQNQSLDFLNLQTIEIIAKKGAKFDIYDLEESSDKTNRLSALYLSQEENSNVLIDGITLSNGNTRNEYFVDLNGKNSELNILGMAIQDNKKVIDTHSVIRHNVSDCCSNELFKFILDDESKGAFSGRIFVAPGASKTSAFQTNRNIVGSDMAKVHSKPQLEIYNDDVKCSHGSATGQLDESQVFYMRARGLSETTAKTLLKQAFMADVIDGVRLQSLKDRLKMLVEKRISGTDVTCSNCSSDCHQLNVSENF